MAERFGFGPAQTSLAFAVEPVTYLALMLLLAPLASGHPYWSKPRLSSLGSAIAVRSRRGHSSSASHRLLGHLTSIALPVRALQRGEPSWLLTHEGAAFESLSLWSWQAAPHGPVVAHPHLGRQPHGRARRVRHTWGWLCLQGHCRPLSSRRPRRPAQCRSARAPISVACGVLSDSHEHTS